MLPLLIQLSSFLLLYLFHNEFLYISFLISISEIIDDNNEEQIITLSIKEAMQILKKCRLLPDEITLNEDNSITFNGKGKISLTQEAEPKLIINTSIV